jgi:hypothetical protein
MDAFEQIVAKAFDVQGYWTRIGFKVNLDKESATPPESLLETLRGGLIHPA